VIDWAGSWTLAPCIPVDARRLSSLDRVDEIRPIRSFSQELS